MPLRNPAAILRIYYLTSIVIGTSMLLPIYFWIENQEIGLRAGLSLVVCWNVLFMMLLPLVMDWAERRYLSARFMALEELARDNPELAAILKEHCQKLSLPGVKLVIVQSETSELVSYGIWRSNPRVIVPAMYLDTSDQKALLSGIEEELQRFNRRKADLVYLLTILAQSLILALTVHFL